MFLINLQAKVPIYEQIQEQILKFIEAGVLQPGTKLPSVRQLAQENGINPNTVAKAYAELEKNGYVYNLAKKGVYVADVNTRSVHTRQLESLIRTCRENGVTKEEVLQAVEHVYEEEEDAEN